MSDHTKIEWADATWTPIRARAIVLQSDGSGKERIGWHCEHVSEGCRNCYAEGMNRRLGTGFDYRPAHLKHATRLGDPRGEVTVFLDEKMLLAPLKWKKPRKIFVCSMTDIFADFVTDAMRDRVFAVCALTPQHTHMILTKRSARMREYFEGCSASARVGLEALGLVLDDLARHPRSRLGAGIKARASDINPGALVAWPLPNVWLGVSVEDQARADERIPDLLATPAAVRFISAEPLLGPVDLTRIREDGRTTGWVNSLYAGLDWVICGGESGPGARPMHPDWARSLRDQCAAAGVAFHFKQWGEWVPQVGAVDGWGRCYAKGWQDEVDDDTVSRIGKKHAGRLLDGVLHDGFPA